MNWLEENINTIICGDSCKLIKLMPDKSIDLIITDPPYLINYKTGRKYLGIEIDDKYYKISVDRLNGITASGQTSIFTDFGGL